MVRVISVHHFTNQQVLTVEQPTASTTAPPNRLLLALPNHSIEVRDLQLGGEILFSFPTVDEVAQICHCINGDYVATLESKFNRQNRELNFARVYINWDSVAALQQSKMNNSGASLGSSECGMVQPMRARIAGRVTPTTNQSELGSLEMIEIPMKRNPHLIQVCQVSGNILICSERIVTFYIFTIKTHDISKLKFVDFEEAPLLVELTFRPREVHLAENYIACLNSDTMHLFKISSKLSKQEYPPLNDLSDSFKFSEDETIDYKKLLETPHKMQALTINLPSIMRENSAVHRHSPFTFSDKDLQATIKSTLGDLHIENLIQLKLKPIMIDNMQKQINEEFKTMVLKPIYIDEVVNRRKNTFANGHAGGLNLSDKEREKDKDNSFLKSQFGSNLHSVACLVATQQEGYMYQFVDQDCGSVTVDNCITVYPFTAPVYKIVLEDYFLHAMTETGLESYTLRLTHRLSQSLNDSVTPSISESVCLVGLRPFIGIEQMLLSNQHLVLLASAESSSPTHSCNSSSSSTSSNWTLYSLELPTPKTIFNDIAIVANSHRLTSSSTYCHLVSEAHMILRTNLVTFKWSSDDGGNVKYIKQKRNDPNVLDSVEVYRNSCTLLGDHYIMCRDDKDFKMATGYYKMAGLQVYDVIKRVKKLQEQAGVVTVSCRQMQGLIHYLNIVLLTPSGSQQSELIGNRAKLSAAVLDLFEKFNFDELPMLILKVPMLREYGTDNLITILSNQTIPISPERYLALVVLHILKGNITLAEDNLEEITNGELLHLLESYWELLFESLGAKSTTSFSELTTLLCSQRGDLLAALFATLIECKLISLGKLLKIFLDYMPSSTDASHYGLVLQMMLEHYFQNYFSKHDIVQGQISYDRSTHEAIKLLVRSYLSQLQYQSMQSRKSERDDKSKEIFLFMNKRREFLNKMPPFAPLISPFDDSKTGKVKYQRNERVDGLLKKLQALLCSKSVPNQVLLEVNTFLGLNVELRGRLSLQICIMSVNDAIGVLADECPQCLLQYAKDMFTKMDEWKLLIATVQQKILTVSHTGTDVEIDATQSKACLYYKKLLKDILTHVAVTMNLENLINVFPQHMDYSSSYILDSPSFSLATQEQDSNDDDVDILKEIQDYEPYITLCKETMHANQIKKLITATGQQLLCTLNL